MNAYLKRVRLGLFSVLKGMRLTSVKLRTGRHKTDPHGISNNNYFKAQKGPITIQYPLQRIPIPEKGRYRLFMETEDCIGCDKCARICPVDCITIETFKDSEEIGKTSDGTPKRLHLPVFDIDMGKCMFCGLCTTVCPTECLTMTKVFDYSEFDRDNFVYHFGGMSPKEEVKVRAETQLKLDAIAEEKRKVAEERAAQQGPPSALKGTLLPKKKPMFKPRIKDKDE